jgi:hypothetical protein
MKVVFLDFDGVLNSGPFLREWRDGPDPIDASAVAHLDRICKATSALVVVSSSWRYMYGVYDFRRLLGHHNFNGAVIDVTPDLSTRTAQAKLHSSPERGEEIQAWLDDNPGVESFVILDDDSDMAHLRHRLVQTDFDVGLTEAHVEQALAILAEPWTATTEVW